MITLEVTKHQAEELLSATGMLYEQYVDLMGNDYNEAVERYNNTIDELRLTLKEQMKEQGCELKS